MSDDVPVPSLTTLTRRPTLAQLAYEELKQSIVTGVLRPNSIHTEAGLARTLGISRASLREATRQLQEEGLIEQDGKPGVVVGRLTRQSVANIYQVRFALELTAAEHAASQIPMSEVEALVESLRAVDPATDPEYEAVVRKTDFEFHDLWVRHSGNELLEKHIGRLRDHVLRISYHIEMPAEHHVLSHGEHVAIAESLLAQDLEAFTAGVGAHIDGVSSRILAQMESQ